MFHKSNFLQAWSFPCRSYPSWVLHIRMRLWLVICQVKHYIWCINLSRRKPDSLSVCLSVYLSFINRVHLLVCLAWIRIRIEGEYSEESCTNKRLLACNFELLVTFCDDNKRNMKWSTSTMKEDLSLSPSLSLCHSVDPTLFRLCKFDGKNQFENDLRRASSGWPQRRRCPPEEEMPIWHAQQAGTAVGQLPCEWASAWSYTEKKCRNICLIYQVYLSKNKKISRQNIILRIFSTLWC